MSIKDANEKFKDEGGVVLIVIFAISAIITAFNIKPFMDYMWTEKPRHVLVLDKLQENGYSNMLYVIVQNDTGYRFEIPVSPTGYYSAHVGEYRTYMLRDYDIKQGNNFAHIMFELNMVITAILLLAIICGYLYCLINYS